MKLNATAAIITILCVTVSTFDGIESKTVASATQIGSTGEKRASTVYCLLVRNVEPNKILGYHSFITANNIINFS